MHEPPSDSAALLVSRRTVDIAVALLLLLFATIFATESVRLGHGWMEGVGPAAGFFPFGISVLLGGASLINLINAIRNRDAESQEDFVTLTGLSRIMFVLLPLAAYIAATQFIGIYVASAIFIAGFMIAFGHNGILKSVLVGTAVPVALFFMFERWFLVPLPKGPLEALLGY